MVGQQRAKRKFKNPQSDWHLLSPKEGAIMGPGVWDGVEWRVVESYPNYLVSENGDIVFKGKNKPRATWLSYANYTMIWMSPGEGAKRQAVRLHRLVAMAFVPAPADKEASTVNHRDGNKRNNAASNLEWMTAADNLRESWKRGNHKLPPPKKGENAPRSILKEADVQSIMVHLHFLGTADIGDFYGVTRGTIDAIRYGRSWQHVDRLIIDGKHHPGYRECKKLPSVPAASRKSRDKRRLVNDTALENTS